MRKTFLLSLLMLTLILLSSVPVMAFDPQPEPPGIMSKIDLGITPGVLGGLSFEMLFPIQESDTGGSEAALTPFGRTLFGLKGFDPQPEPPGIIMHQ